MDYIQFFTLFATMVGGCAFIHKEVKSFEKEIREDVKTQAARSDKLYQMFLDLLKERK